MAAAIFADLANRRAAGVRPSGPRDFHRGNGYLDGGRGILRGFENRLRASVEKSHRRPEQTALEAGPRASEAAVPRREPGYRVSITEPRPAAQRWLGGSFSLVDLAVLERGDEPLEVVAGAEGGEGVVGVEVGQDRAAGVRGLAEEGDGVGGVVVGQGLAAFVGELRIGLGRGGAAGQQPGGVEATLGALARRRGPARPPGGPPRRGRPGRSRRAGEPFQVAVQGEADVRVLVVGPQRLALEGDGPFEERPGGGRVLAGEAKLGPAGEGLAEVALEGDLARRLGDQRLEVAAGLGVGASASDGRSGRGEETRPGCGRRWRASCDTRACSGPRPSGPCRSPASDGRRPRRRPGGTRRGC